MRIFCRTLVREWSLLDAHMLRFLNAAYREFARTYVIPRLSAGEPVTLNTVSDTIADGSSARYILPYDHEKCLAFFDGNGRNLDVLPSTDVRAFDEYGSLGSFVQFYEYQSGVVTPLYDSVSASVTLGIPNRSTTATASSAIFTDEHVGEWLLPIHRNTATAAANPENYAYRIASTSGTVAAPSTTCTLERPFRGVLSDAGAISDLTTGYFEIRPRASPIIRIWGAQTSTDDLTIRAEYQRTPSKLANPEDIPEEPRLAEALCYKTILLSGVAFREAFQVKIAEAKIAEALGGFRSSSEFDRLQIRNFIVGNPNARSYSELGANRLGFGYATTHGGVRY